MFCSLSFSTISVNIIIFKSVCNAPFSSSIQFWLTLNCDKKSLSDWSGKNRSVKASTNFKDTCPHSLPSPHCKHTHAHNPCIMHVPSPTDGEEVGERGPGDGREAGQDELIEIPSDDENETTPALTLDPSADPSTDRSLSASHGEWGGLGLFWG